MRTSEVCLLLEAEKVLTMLVFTVSDNDQDNDENDAKFLMCISVQTLFWNQGCISTCFSLHKLRLPTNFDIIRIEKLCKAVIVSMLNFSIIRFYVCMFSSSAFKKQQLHTSKIRVIVAL